MADLPRPNTFTRFLANYLLQNRDTFGRVDASPLQATGTTLHQFRITLIALRKRFRFYTRRNPDQPWLVYVPAHWPSGDRVDCTFRTVQLPRLTKFRGPPANSPKLRELYDFIMNNRGKNNFINLKPIYQKLGTHWVRKKLKILQLHYGFEIEKPIPGLHDSLWIIRKIPNVQTPMQRPKPATGKELAELAFFGEDVK